jgi:single-strand DNA-binding protein
MPNFCNVVVAGHLGGDPELKNAANGNAICTFSVATKTGYGERECSTWRRVTIFGKRGEKAAELLRKGTAVIISGEEQNREWLDKEGQKRYSLEVTAHDWSFAGGKSDEKQERPKAKPQAQSDAYEDDIPF